MSSRMVDRISKVLNQAERAAEGSPEREAFMERAMQLSQLYSIDLALARAHQANKEKIETPERRSFKVGEAGPRKKGANAWFVDLMLAVCAQNDIEVVIGGANTHVHGTGMPSDLDMAERLFTILSVQMVSEADAGLKQGQHGKVQLLPVYRTEDIPEDDREWGAHDGSDTWTQRAYYDEQDELIDDWGKGPMRRRGVERGQTYETQWVRSYPPPKTRKVPVLDNAGGQVYEERFAVITDARIWRANFYQGFIQRTATRLREARRKALKEAGVDLTDESDGKAIVLRDKAKEVRAAFEENEKFVLSSGRTYDGASTSQYSADGHTAGDTAATRARLGDERDLGDSE